MVFPPLMSTSLLKSLNHPATLRDGSVIGVRPIRPADAVLLRQFHARLSPDAIALRYFELLPTLPDALVTSYTHIDYVDRMVFVATDALPESVPPDKTQRQSGGVRQEGEELVGLANYCWVASETAEVAFLVADAWQGRGIGTLLLYELADYARDHGFRRFVAFTLSYNMRMLSVLRHGGFPCVLKATEGGEVVAHLDIGAPPTPAW